MGWELAIQPATALAEQGIEALNAKKQFERTKELMDIQNRNQQMLNKQGQQLQMETWNQTNYPAQIEMLKKAGLNPSLMYAKGGAGGTTGSQGGGSAAMGSAVKAQTMGIGNILESKQMMANIKLTEEQAKLAKTQAENIEGVQTEKARTEISKIIAETANEALKGELIKVQTTLEGIKATNEQTVIDNNVRKVKQEIDNLNQQNRLTADQFNSLVKITAEEATGAVLRNALTGAQTKLTETETRTIATKIVQDWTRLSQEGRKLEQKDMEIAIETFKAEIAAEYPGLMNVAGGVLKKAYDTLENLGTGKVWTPQDKVK